MADLPHPWGAYACLQEELSHNSRVDDRAWGSEAGLNLILAPVSTATQPSQDDIDRAVASGARQERYRAQLRALYLCDEELAGPSAGLLTVETRQTLQLIKNSVTNSDWALLCEVAAGHEYIEIAARQRATASSLRTRVLRLRHSLVALAA